MQINNQVDTSGGGTGLFVDTRDIKDKADGIKVRLYGDAAMGYSYFQKGDPKPSLVRSQAFPEMVDPTDGYQGAEQTPTTCFYIAAWNYATDAPCLLELNKKTLINAIIAVNDDADLADVTDYDFKITFDDKKDAAEKYTVTRLDKSELTPEQKKALKAFTPDLAAHAAGGEAFPKAE